MEMPKIRIKGDPILRQKAKKVSRFENKKMTELAQVMEKVMKEEYGIGLAAPQIGLSERIILVKTKEGPLLLINPEITKKSLLKNIAEEGCLSVPGIFGLVKRHNTISVSALNSEKKTLKFKAKGMFARVIQHEVDHLDGILFIDKIVKNGPKGKDERKI